MNHFVKQLAVIMARGESRRMGQSKGLCRLGNQDDPFVLQIAKTYSQCGLPVLLIVRPEDEADYSKVLAGVSVEILAAPGGGDTAQTMSLALDWARARGLAPHWFWAHPVDMPLVSEKTINDLWTAASAAPANAWRPAYEGTPGHPVLMPGNLLSRLLEKDPAGKSMSEIWKAAVARALVSPMQLLKVDDDGVITDYDTPDQLKTAAEKKEPGS
jgi:molybdenum cofactor cytidylyltransferase